jgi:hypothetical protein
MENEQTAAVKEECKEWCGGRCGKSQHTQWKRHGGGGVCGGGMWFVGWLFTIGFLQLAFWKGVLAIVLWPYFLGVFLAQ